ncbi:trypsin-like serine protease [Bacteriovoracaceae bacterium]|nr:trypsin-like serine protease [Bacteriovoracaceae bacterium]
MKTILCAVILFHFSFPAKAGRWETVVNLGVSIVAIFAVEGSAIRTDSNIVAFSQDHFLERSQPWYLLLKSMNEVAYNEKDFGICLDEDQLKNNNELLKKHLANKSTPVIDRKEFLEAGIDPSSVGTLSIAHLTNNPFWIDDPIKRKTAIKDLEQGDISMSALYGKCSGTLITFDDQTAIVTARHCLDIYQITEEKTQKKIQKNRNTVKDTQITIVTFKSFTGVEYALEEAYFIPQNSRDPLDDYDVAILPLKKENLSKNTKPASIALQIGNGIDSTPLLKSASETFPIRTKMAIDHFAFLPNASGRNPQVVGKTRITEGKSGGALLNEKGEVVSILASGYGSDADQKDGTGDYMDKSAIAVDITGEKFKDLFRSAFTSKAELNFGIYSNPNMPSDYRKMLKPVADSQMEKIVRLVPSIK